MMTVVIDTNVLISAEHDEYSYTRRIVDLVREGKIRAIGSRQTLQENKGILSRIVNNRSWYTLLDEYFDAVEYVSVSYRIGEDRVVAGDREDEKFVRLAQTGRAKYIITEDRHLLDIEEHDGIKIVTPKDFWYEYKSLADGGTETGAWADFMRQVMGR